MAVARAQHAAWLEKHAPQKPPPAMATQSGTSPQATRASPPKEAVADSTAHPAIVAAQAAATVRETRGSPRLAKRGSPQIATAAAPAVAAPAVAAPAAAPAEASATAVAPTAALPCVVAIETGQASNQTPGGQSEWHPEFPIEEIQLPPSRPLPPFPRLERPRSLATTATKDTVAAHGRDTSVAIVDSQNTDLQAVPAGCEGLSGSLIAKIHGRQLAAEVERLAKPAALRAWHLQQLPRLAVAIRSYMHGERGHKTARSTMPLDELLTRVKADQRQYFSIEELTQQQALLMELAPQWHSVIDLSGRTFARIDNTVPFADVLDSLKHQAQAATSASKPQ